MQENASIMIFANDRVDVRSLNHEPFIYLAGPGTDWQDKAIDFLRSQSIRLHSKLAIALPSEYRGDRPFAKYVLPADKWYCLPGDGLKLAQKEGCVVYWLSLEGQEALGSNQEASVEKVRQEIMALIEVMPFAEPKISVGVEDSKMAPEVARVTGLTVCTELDETIRKALNRINQAVLERIISSEFGMTISEYNKLTIDDVIALSERRNGHSLRFRSFSDQLNED